MFCNSLCISVVICHTLLLWEQGVPSSSPGTPTKATLYEWLFLLFNPSTFSRYDHRPTSNPHHAHHPHYGGAIRFGNTGCCRQSRQVDSRLQHRQRRRSRESEHQEGAMDLCHHTVDFRHLPRVSRNRQSLRHWHHHHHAGFHRRLHHLLHPCRHQHKKGFSGKILGD